jgi:hypothetical protein
MILNSSVPGSSSTRVGRFVRGYTTISQIVLNSLLLFAILNLFAMIAIAWVDSRARATTHRYARAWLIEGYGLDTLARGYPGLSRADIEAFLYETSNWFQEYEPFTGFRPVERHDRYISIDRNGYRPVPSQGSWPPDEHAFNLFLFGGSTMMGAGVPDDQTIAAFLQRAFHQCAPPVRVYNFGRGFYFSTQERILFEQLILAGHVPNAAIFFDGLNDFYFAEGVPQFTPEFADFVKRRERSEASAPFWPAVVGALRALPLAKVAARTGWMTIEPEGAPPSPAQSPSRTDEERVREVLDRWQRNRAMIETIADRYRVRLGVVWQPVPTYAYDRTKLNVYREGVDLFGAHRLSEKGYAQASSRFGHEEQGSHLLWLGDLQRNRSENLYVDAVHYTGSFSSEIAAQIAAFATQNGIVPCTF